MRATDKLDLELAAKRLHQSPQFPSLDEALERQRQKREALAARVLLALTLVFGIATPFAEHPGFMLLGACVFAVGFVITCFTAGSRHVTGGEHSGRPF